jgi:HK97 family phage portal protein
MALRDLFRSRASDAPRVEPRFASVMAAGNTVELLTLNDPRLAEILQGGAMSNSGVAISQETALKVAVAWRCVNIRRTVMSSMPRDLMRRIDERNRKPATDHPFRDVLTVKPNRWQTPAQFIGLLTAHKLLKGNGYAFKRTLGGEIRELIPLDPSRMEVNQADDLSISYRYQQRNGSFTTFKQSEIFHVSGISLDGVRGLSVIDHAREAMGLSIQAEKIGAKLFKNGRFRSEIYGTDGALSDTAYERLQKDLKDGTGANDEAAGSPWILEEGLKPVNPALSANDMQFLGIRAFERTDVGMFFGCPPFIYGDTEKSTSWGTGLEQQNLGFLQYTVQEDITAWEEALKRDCLAGDDPNLYVHFDANGFFRLDAQGRREYFKAALGSGGAPAWMTPNEVREKEDMQPRKEPWADELPKQQPPKQGKNPDDNPTPPGN